MFLVVKKFLHDGLWVTSFFLFVPKKKKEKSIVGSNSRATGYRCVSLLGLKRETQNTVSIDIANRRFPYLSSDPFEYSFCRNKRYCPVLSSRLLTHKPGKTVYEYFCSTNISFLPPPPPPQVIEIRIESRSIIYSQIIGIRSVYRKMRNGTIDNRWKN